MSISPGQFSPENPHVRRIMPIVTGVLAALVLLGWYFSRQQPVEYPALAEVAAPVESAEFSEKIAESPVDPDPLSDEILPMDDDDDSNSPEARAGQRVLVFKNREEFLRFRDAAQRAGIAVLGSIDALNALLLGTADSDLLRRLAEETGADPVQEVNPIMRLPDQPAARDIDSAGVYEPFGLEALALMGLTGDATWGQGVKVAILDGGLLVHEVFRNGQPVLIDMFGNEVATATGNAHGTAVASIIGGDIAGKIGIAPGSELSVYRVMDGAGLGDSFILANAIVQAVDSGVNLINMSLAAPPGSGQSAVLNAALDYAMDRGVLLMIAAGNDGVQGVSYPASYPGVVSVGAIDRNGTSMPFSNVGDNLSLVAGGYGIPAAASDPGSVQGFTGTSAASPVVTAMVSALMSLEPRLTATQAANLLVEYADDLGLPGVDAEYGAGSPNLQRVLNRNGTGVLDVAASGAGIAKTTATHIEVVVTAQNRGNEVLPQGQMQIDVSGIKTSVSLSGLKPNEIRPITVRVPVSRVAAEGQLQITAQTNLGFRQDFNPANDQLVKILRLK